MKTIEVVAAIIKNGENFLATKRGYGEFEDFWEFPGGKIENSESREAALKREIKEELNCEIEIEKFAITVEYTYSTFHLVMHCFICKLANDFELLEHKDAKWLNKDTLDSVEWLPADIEVIDFLRDYL